MGTDFKGDTSIEWRRKNDGKLIGGKGRNKITVFHRATWGRLRGRKVSCGWNCQEIRETEGLWNCDSSLILWSSLHALPRRNQKRTLIELNLLWVEALNSNALLKKRIYYLCGKNFYTIALNPLMCLDIWHTRTIRNKFHFTCILNKLCHVALLSIYIYLPYHPLKYSYDFPNYDLILFNCVLYNILSCSRQNFTRGTNDDAKKGISI